MQILFIHSDPNRWEDWIASFVYEGDTVISVKPTSLRREEEGQKLDVILVALNQEETLSQPIYPSAIRKDIPWILLADRLSSQEIAFFLQCGYDDVVRFPVDYRELKARIQAILRRCRAQDSIPFNPFAWQMGDLHLDLVHRIARSDTAEVQFTPHEFLIFLLLWREPGKVFNRAAIAHEIWRNGGSGQERTVDVYVRRLRDKLESLGWQDRLQTKWGEGYYLITGTGGTRNVHPLG